MPEPSSKLLRAILATLNGAFVVLGLAPGLYELSEKLYWLATKSPQKPSVVLQGAEFHKGASENLYVAINFASVVEFPQNCVGLIAGAIFEHSGRLFYSAPLGYGPFDKAFQEDGAGRIHLENFPLTKSDLTAIAKEKATLLIYAKAVYRCDGEVCESPVSYFCWNSNLEVFETVAEISR